MPVPAGSRPFPRRARGVPAGARECCLSALLAAVLLAAPPRGIAAPAPAAPPPVVLVETRPLETTLGDSTLAAAQATWLDMIRGARTTLDLEHFYLAERPGEALSPVLRAIGEAAGRGVRVRLLLDARMSRTYPQPAESLATLANVELRKVDYGRLAGGVQHAKFMIVDGSDAFVGSQNLDWRALSHIHELGARVRIPEVAMAIGAVFETDWNAADTTSTAPPVDRGPATWPVAFTQDGVPGQVWLSASPRAQTPASIPWDHDVLLEHIASAQREIILQTLTYGVGGYGVVDSTLHQALAAAAGRGVTVKLLVSDWVIGGGGEAALRALAALPNVEVRISHVPDWSGGYIPFARVEHCKYVVSDGERLWLGTSNLEPSYFFTSRNLALTVHHAPLAQAARRIFEHGWTGPTAMAFHADTQLAPRPHGEKAPEGAKVYAEE
jgi:phosphatidylserine/phosphatidylglycerophosphate/cardiolipin synthase-like enzyme